MKGSGYDREVLKTDVKEKLNEITYETDDSYQVFDEIRLQGFRL